MKKNIHIIYQVVFAALALFGVIVEVVIRAGISKGANMLSYFTIQSNLIIAATYILNMITSGKNVQWMSALKSCALLWILITGVVFHFMLSKFYKPEGIFAYSNFILHYVTPVGMLLNWLIFEEKGRFKYSFSIFWVLYPILYVIISQFRAILDGFYPYWFINPTKPYPDGAGSGLNVVIITAVLAVVFCVIGVILVFIDNRLKNKVAV
ncbi:MAG TPA: Pr6Pr family membrane protein [Spirochaetota bacterium]|jgi:hypothetical protein|nr:MAG: hypothetical protein BWX91_02552 [Spirochaetes bacterium ADurb.Bin133]HNZ28100.1 Pr6Pr family membrane protein [Spirochaetota bacterium]HPY88775.1 Pr6Pr family membrane protein [Spirochaetota bacterium]